MKYTTLIAILLASNSINSEDLQRKNVVVYVSSNNVNRNSNTIDGHEMQPFTYKIIPQPYQQPTGAVAPTYQSPQLSQEPPLMMNAIPAAQEQTPIRASNTNTPSWQMPSISEMFTSLKNTACTVNPYTITAGALVALYATYLVKVYNTAFQVMKKNTWATWKEHIPVEVMLEIPHLEVAEELFNAIKAKYLPISSSDLMTPIVKFNNAVDQELAQLNSFIRLHEWLNYTKLGYIFPKHEMEIAHAHTKIKRLVFLKDVLLAWTSDYSSAIMHDKFIPRFQQQPVQQVVNEPNPVDETTTLECL